MSRRPPFRRDERGVSEVVGVALLVGLVVVGAATVLLVGGAELSDGRDRAEVGQAEQALTQFDAEAERVATGGTTARTVDLGLRGNAGTLDADGDSGRITVEYVDEFEDGNRTVVMDAPLGAVTYRSGTTQVAYQGGGVWRADGEGSTMVSPPEIAFRNGTLVMHVVRTRPGGSVHSEVAVGSANSTEPYPNASAGLENKVEGAVVQISVQSRYYRAWGRYFEDETNTVVQYDDGNRVVTVLFLALPVDYSPDAGVVATSGPGKIRLGGTGAYIDSYNSSNGTYAETRDKEGTVTSAGEVELYGDSQIDGDVTADKNVSVESSSGQIDGDATSGRYVNEHDDTSVTGQVTEQASGVPPTPPVTRLVERRVSDLAADNDNDGTAAISNDRLDLEASNELTAGHYYLERMDLEGETLVVNTTDGDVVIAVETWVKLLGAQGNDPTTSIEVEGDGQLRLFVGSEETTTVNVPGEGERDVHFFVERDSRIATTDDDRERSPQVVLFGPDHFEGAIAGSSSENPSVTGLVIAPAGPLGDGNFYVKNGELYGAVMTGNLTLGQYGEIHFDKAVRDVDIPLAPEVPRLEYLYVEDHEVEVEEES